MNVKHDSNWNITLEQLVNGMYGIDTFVVHDCTMEDEPEGEEMSFGSKYLPRHVLHPQYAFAKVTHCEVIDKNKMRVYVDLQSKEEKHD